jgi:hypothetical protein
MSRFVLWSTVGFIAFIGALVAGLWYARGAVIATFDNDRSRAEWSQWRDETLALSTSTRPSERRRPARAAEPPLLIMMRDHFAAVAGTSALMGSIAYWFVVLAARGAVRTPDRFAASPPERATR